MEAAALAMLLVGMECSLAAVHLKLSSCEV